MSDNAFFRAGDAAWARELPPSVAAVGEKELLSRHWELLVLNGRGAARLAELRRLPLCRTVLLPQEAGCLLRARQVVDCGLSRRSSLTLSSLSAPPVLCVQRRLAAVGGGFIEPQDIPLPLRWSHLPPETLLLTAGAWLLAQGRLPK